MTIDNIEVISSIIIAVVSLAWGMYQNVEKKKRDIKLESLQTEIHALEIAERKHKLRPKLSMAYLETTTGELLTYSSSPLARFTLPVLSPSEIDSTLSAWLRGIESSIPLSGRASLVSTPLLVTLQDFFTQEHVSESAKDRLFFLLLVNEGNYAARNIRIRTRIAEHSLTEQARDKLEQTLDQSVHAPDIVIDRLNPQDAILALFTHIGQEGKRLGYEIEPAGPIQFIDELSENTEELATRIPYEVARIVDKGLLIRG